MSVFYTELFIARRMAAAASSRKNVMVRIATLTVAVGMAVMILSLAVISGFKAEITGRLLGFSAHVQIVRMDGNNSLETNPILRDSLLEQRIATVPGFASIAPFVIKGGIIRTDKAIEGVMLKGVDGQYDMAFYRDHLMSGTLPRIGDSVRYKDLLISETTASLLETAVGEPLEMVFVNADKPPRRDRFRVSGTYATGMDELDRTTVLTDIRNVQRLNGWDNEEITGYEIRSATGIAKLEPFTESVYEAAYDIPDGTIPQLRIQDLRMRYPNLFDWLKAHNVNAAVILVIMLAVALLNMISALLIILLESTSTIGMLKAVGMTNRSLQRLFLIRSSFIVLRGMFWGNVVGLALALAQHFGHFVRLDPSGYMLSEVPIRLGWGWWVGLNAGTLGLILLLLTLPTLVIGSIRPEKTLRYQ